MIYECTDCKHCADFDFGFRVFCLHPDFPSDEVDKYHPVGNEDADYCKGFDNWFDENEPHQFSMKEFEDAERYSEEKYGDVTYKGIREWCLEHLK